MKRRAVCFLLCLSFFFCSGSLKSSAVDEDVLYTADDLIDFGFVQEDSYFYLPAGSDNPFDDFSWFSTSQKNYPDFNPLTDIPWSTFPDYVFEILSLGLEGLTVPELTDFQLPFFLVTVRGNNVDIYVGVNVGLGQVNLSEMYCYIYGLKDTYPPGSGYSNDSLAALYSHSKLYRCTYNYKYEYYSVDWSVCQPSLVGDMAEIYCFTEYSVCSNSVKNDYYFYGANGVGWASSASAYDIRISSTNVNYTINFSFLPNGFASGNILSFQNVGFANCYFEYFVPPTRESLSNQLQQEENETSKGIWETLKSIPEAIGEKIKSLFVPSDDYFDTYQQEFQTYFKDRFGILYEIPELIINLLTKFVTFNPKEGDYFITFPEVLLPILEDGEWRKVVLIEETKFSFDFVNEAPFSILYYFYVSFIWLVYIMLLINLIKNKANGVFKGG